MDNSSHTKTLADHHSHSNAQEQEHSWDDFQSRIFYWRTGLGFFFFIAAITMSFWYVDYPFWLRLTLYLSSYFFIGLHIIISALLSVRHGDLFNETTLMTLATVGAFTIGEYPEGVAVMIFYTIGELLQDRAVDRSRRSIKDLMNIRPDFANLIQGDDTVRVSPFDVQRGDIILVKAGERIPLDGTIISGESRVDTSPLTGESVPRRVIKGDEVLGGTINQTGLLKVQVAREFSESTVAKILQLVEMASSKKAPIEKFITRFARYYTPAVVFCAASIALLPPLFIEGAVFGDWVYRGLIFLVISCPCALVLSIPVSFFGGIGRASRQGILIKGGNYLEGLNKVATIVYDKTGTLTEGVFKVTEILPVNNYSQDEVLAYASLAEINSTHPIGRSILEAWEKPVNKGSIQSYQEYPGEGIQVTAAGETIMVGNTRLMDRMGIDYVVVEKMGTVVYVVVNNQFMGSIIINDQLKEDSKTTIQTLRSMGIKKQIMLTGDRDVVSKQVADYLGLDGYYAQLLPHDKVMKMEELLAKRSKKSRLVFVGDGINDAPVLARSDIGIAMGALGSDAAIEAADIVLMTDEPGKIVAALETARKTKNIVWQNIIFALGVKGIVLTLGGLGIATLWAAIFADVGVAFLAVLNAVRIIKPPRT